VDALVEARSVIKRFGGLTAVDEVDLSVSRGRTTALIGPNGAGKSTLLNVLTGLMPTTSGEVLIKGESIKGRSCYSVAGLGIARTFQTVQLFHNMTVLENVMVGCHTWTRQGMGSGAIRWIGHWREERAILSRSMAELDRVGLADAAHSDAGSLPFGKQRLLEIARALASKPSVLLLDEPASGLSTRETSELANLLRQIVADGLTVLLVDHDMQFVMEISDRVAVLDQGRKIAEGTPQEVQNDQRVIAAYLGSEAR
jgi:branched-chain amino acid transport system ATP-binding protein